MLFRKLRRRQMAGIVFDLDGTLVDTVYQHAVSWQSALRAHGIRLPLFEVHRRIGMDGALLLSSLSQAFGFELSQELADTIELAHAEAYRKLAGTVDALPGATDIDNTLRERNIAWAIVTSAGMSDARSLLELIRVPDDVPLITREQQRASKPDPTPILTALEQLRVAPHDGIVVGDSVWDMLASRRTGALGVGVLTGGYSADELSAAGAFRVYRDVSELLRKTDEFVPRR